MATLNEMGFIFAGESSEEYGIFMCSAIGSTSPNTGDEKSSIITTKSLYKDTFDLHYIKYDEPLAFQIILVKTDGTYIDAKEEARLKKWLCKNHREWLIPIQDDLDDVMYYVIMNNPEKIDIGRYSGGIKFEVTCDAPFAWSGLKKKAYTCTGTLTFNFNSIVDYDDYILSPTLIIKPTVNGTVNIKNSTTNEIINITNCVTSETITIDCKNDKIKSSSSRIMLSDWNKNTISLQENNNSVTLTGNFTMEMQYRLPVRIGG